MRSRNLRVAALGWFDALPPYLHGRSRIIDRRDRGFTEQIGFPNGHRCLGVPEYRRLGRRPAPRGRVSGSSGAGIAAFPVASLGLILLTASLVAMLCRRVALPYSTGLVAAGIGLGFLPAALDVSLSRDLIFDVLLPPLIFEAALQMEWRSFRRELPATLTLAFLGIVVAAGVVALGLHALFGWTWIGAGLFGILIAATDPVSVIAAFKEMRVESRLSLIVESESLLNDGAAAVGFGILVAVAEGGSGSAGAVALSLAWTVVGGVAIGGAIAAALLLVAGRTDDRLVELTLTTIAAFGSFLLAERVGASGVLATLTAGLLVGNYGWKRAISEHGQGYVLSFWQFAAFLANSIIFLLIGTEEAHQSHVLFSIAALGVIALTLAGRALAVYPLCLLFSRSALRVPLPYQHVLVWSGLRGALALALALALPVSVPERPAIVVLAFAAVAFSVFVQGLTMPWLVKRLGFVRQDA